MGPFVAFGSRFIVWRGAILGAVQALIRCHPSPTRAVNDPHITMTQSGAIMQTETLALLRRAEGALSAYEVLDGLRATHPKIVPPTVYNALTALVETGRVHRIVSLKAYVACQCRDAHRKEPHLPSVFSICGMCGTVKERVAPQIVRDISSVVQQDGLTPRRHVVEVHGTCQTCAEDA